MQARTAIVSAFTLLAIAVPVAHGAIPSDHDGVTIAPPAPHQPRTHVVRVTCDTAPTVLQTTLKFPS